MTMAFSKQTATQSAFQAVTITCSPVAFSRYTNFVIFPAQSLFLNSPHSELTHTGL